MDTNQNTVKLKKAESWFRKGWHGANTLLFTSSDSVQEVGERKRVELLARLTFFFALLNTFGLFFTLKVPNPTGRLVLLTLSVVLWTAYALSRTRYYSAGGILAITVWVVITFAYALSGATTNGPLFVLVTFLPLVFALSTGLLKFRQQIFLIGMALAFCLLMPIFEPGIARNRSYKSSMGVLICLGGLTLLNQSYRDAIEHERLTDSNNKNESIRFQADLLDHVGQAIIACRIDNTTVYWNHASESMYGWKADEVLGRNIFEVTPFTATPEALTEIATALRGGLDWSGEMSVQHRNGRLIPVLYTIAPLKDDTGKVTGWISIAADITERKNIQLEREKLIEDLEGRNSELERFTYTVSHDLRSPLVTIQGYLGYIEDSAIKGNIERIRSDSQRIKNATTRMQKLLNDLLDLSRIGRLINPPENVSFEEIAWKAFEQVRGQIEKRGVSVRVSPNLPIIHGDKERLIEMVQNLIDNACKYMGDQTQPQIEIGQQGISESGMPIFHVRDNGIGIESKYQQKVFGLFDKLDATSEGTGIGLALVKRIVEVHGGKIWVESEGTGKGTTFRFTLPVKE